MKTFILVLDAVIYVALAFAFVEVYLKVNKIWKRKGEEQVAQSQSIFGLSISLFVLTVWTLKYIIIGEYTSIIDNGIYMMESVVMMLIGTGIFVKKNKGLGLFKLLKKAIRLERKEASYLLQALSGKGEAAVILNILHQLAWIDNDLDKKEVAMIKDFAKAWGLEYSEKNEKLIAIPEEFNEKLSLLRQTMEKYIDTEPENEQIAQLTDLLKRLINADEEVSEEEEIIFDELNALMLRYLNKDRAMNQFHVLIVPQEKTQADMVKKLRPNAREVKTSGGIAFSLEQYLSEKFAEHMCDSYREKGLFTIVQELPEEKFKNDSKNGKK